MFRTSGDKTTLDAIELSPKPIAFTALELPRVEQSSASQNRRSDSQTRGQGRRHGHHGRAHVRPKIGIRPPSEDIVDHIDHVVKLVGIDHVGIGSDCDSDGIRSYAA